MLDIIIQRKGWSFLLCIFHTFLFATIKSIFRKIIKLMGCSSGMITEPVQLTWDETLWDISWFLGDRCLFLTKEADDLASHPILWCSGLMASKLKWGKIDRYVDHMVSTLFCIVCDSFVDSICFHNPFSILHWSCRSQHWVNCGCQVVCLPPTCSCYYQ